MEFVVNDARQCGQRNRRCRRDAAVMIPLQVTKPPNVNAQMYLISTVKPCRKTSSGESTTAENHPTIKTRSRPWGPRMKQKCKPAQVPVEEDVRGDERPTVEPRISRD